ncbi:MAG: hypothetical protein ACYCQI_11610 [Gammaproteobacteria bacterium]
MSANYVLVSQVDVLPEKLCEVESKYHEILSNEVDPHALYVPYDKNPHSILVLRSLDNSLEKLVEIDKKRDCELDARIKKYLISDWKQQILKFEENVKPLNDALPSSDYLQLRHIEVPLRIYSEYLSWRKETIFEHVKQQEQIDFFLSYHSLISTEPGVMFLSGFSCEPEDYLKIFNNPKYLEIVKNAGDKFISGGVKGLYTTIYQRSYN